ncbi:MAG: hypothetical protein WD876_03055 [Candidatus Pacearchaeota archaeon]
MNLKSMFKTWKDVFGKWQYLLLGLFIAVLFYLFNVFIAGWRSLIGFYSVNGFVKTVNFFFVLFFGFRSTLTSASFVSMVVISLLLGMLFSMLIYKTYFHMKFNNKNLGAFGVFGAFLAVFIPGCAACGVGVASVLGLSAGALAFLPYDGIELSILAVIILGVTIFITTKNLYSCKVPEIKVRRLKGDKFPINAQKSLKENKSSVKRVNTHMKGGKNKK